MSHKSRQRVDCPNKVDDEITRAIRCCAIDERQPTIQQKAPTRLAVAGTSNVFIDDSFFMRFAEQTMLSKTAKNQPVGISEKPEKTNGKVIEVLTATNQILSEAAKAQIQNEPIGKLQSKATRSRSESSRKKSSTKPNYNSSTNISKRQLHHTIE